MKTVLQTTYSYTFFTWPHSSGQRTVHHTVTSKFPSHTDVFSSAWQIQSILTTTLSLDRRDEKGQSLVSDIFWEQLNVKPDVHLPVRLFGISSVRNLRGWACQISFQSWPLHFPAISLTQVGRHEQYISPKLKKIFNATTNG